MTTDAPPTAPTTRRAPWRAWVALILLALPMFMMATDFTAVFLAMPPLTAALTPSATQTLWIVHIGELVAAGTLITMGWLTGRVGPRALLLLALVLYGIGSALAAFAPGAEAFLAARVLIGLATAAASPAALAMLRTLFTGSRDYAVAFAVVMGAFPVGTALGPPLTGLLLEHFWWGSVFLVNVPVAVVALVGGLWLFARAEETTSDRIDLVGVVISTAAVMFTVFGLQEIADRGVSIGYVAAVAAGLALGVWFLRRQRRIPNPLLDPTLFSTRAFRISVLFFLLVPLAFMATDLILVQHLQVVVGVPTSTLGLLLALPGVAAILATALTPALVARFAPARIMTVGIGIGLLGVTLILIALTMLPAPWLFATGMTIVSIGMSPPLVLGAQLMIASVPKVRTGPAAAVQDISASLGNAIGIMVLGSLATMVFDQRVRADVPPGFSAGDVDAATESLGAATALATETGGTEGADLLSTVHEAWTWGTLGVFVAAFTIGLVMMILVGRGLRGVRLPVDDGADADAPDVADSAGDADAAEVVVDAR